MRCVESELRQVHAPPHACAAPNATLTPPPPPLKNQKQQIKTVVASGVAEVLLDRPKALNALNEPMVLALKRLYSEWDAEAAARGGGGGGGGGGGAPSAVVLRAAPSVRDRAFCAGGDVKGVVMAAREGRAHEALRFFEHEYACDWAIGGPLARELERASNAAVNASASSASLPLPPPSPLSPFVLPLRVALVDGIVMGGGVGLSIHGHAVVATERTMFAMPEVAIGLHPDVGVMAKLVGGGGAEARTRGTGAAPAAAAAPSAPATTTTLLTPRVGLWLALSGARVGGAALKALGLATHCVPSWKLDEAVASLREKSGGGGRGGGSGGGLAAGDPAALASALASFEFRSEQEADEAALASRSKGGAMTARELRERLPLIERAFGAADAPEHAADPGGAVAAIVAALRTAAADNACPSSSSFASSTADAIEAGSAFSAAVTVEYARRVLAAAAPAAATSSPTPPPPPRPLLRRCLAADYSLVQRFVLAGAETGDFWEGVRAKLIDRGDPPARWRYSSGSEVPVRVVQGMFAPLDAADAARALRGAGIWGGGGEEEGLGALSAAAQGKAGRARL
jgi:enoyl-CoA hydratase/carnithine racemase